MIFPTHRLEARIGSAHVHNDFLPVMFEHADPEVLTNILLDHLPYYAQHKLGLPIETNRHHWVGLTGKPGLDGVIGPRFGYRALRPDDFTPNSSGSIKTCSIMLLPPGLVPNPCDKPGCRKWAQYTFGVKTTVRGLSHYVWGKTVGNTIHACPEHAHELYSNDHLMSKYQETDAR